MKIIYIVGILSLLISCTNKTSEKFKREDEIYERGIDISHHNQGINWDKLNIDFIFLKASEGSTFKDPKFQEYRKEANRVNIPYGAYHYFTEADGNSQFKNYFKQVKYNIKLLPVIDIEITKLNKKELSEELSKFIYNCVSVYKVYPIIYTSDYFYKKYLSEIPEIKNCPIWLGDIDNYNVSTPHIMHQIKIQKIPGTRGKVDYNHLYVPIDYIKYG